MITWRIPEDNEKVKSVAFAEAWEDQAWAEALAELQLKRLRDLYGES